VLPLIEGGKNPQEACPVFSSHGGLSRISNNARSKEDKSKKNRFQAKRGRECIKYIGKNSSLGDVHEMRKQPFAAERILQETKEKQKRGEGSRCCEARAFFVNYCGYVSTQ